MACCWCGVWPGPGGGCWPPLIWGGEPGGGIARLAVEGYGKLGLPLDGACIGSVE